MNKRVVVLGATGSLGAHICVHLKKCGYDVLAVGHSKNDNGFFSDYNIEYTTIDISKQEEFGKLPQYGIWAILHFAGALPAGMRGYNGGIYVSSIVQGTLNVLEYCRKAKVDRIIFPQSLFDVYHLFGTPKPISPELTHLAPLEGDHAMYVICKNAACDMIEHYYKVYGLKRFIFRLSRIYLYHPNPYTFTDGKKVMVSDRYLIYKAMRGEELQIWGDPNRVLETISVYDFLQIIEKAVSAGIDGGVYNVGSGGSTLKERIEGIVDVFSPQGSKCKISYCPEKPSATQFLLDFSKTSQELGYVPHYSWKDYLNEFKKEMKEQRFAKLWGVESDYIASSEAI
jgi:UDP-glucose 4-epimerase